MILTSKSPRIASTRIGLDRVYAVHATRFLPKDGVVRCDGDANTFRPHLHFSLGGLVRPHGQGDWDHMPYAVVAPLTSLEPQLLSVMAHDTLVLGDLTIPSDAVLVMPRDKLDQAPEGVRAVGVDPGVPLRKAIEQVIEGEGGVVVETRNGTGNVYDRAMLGKTNINDPEFFSPLLEKHPQLSFGGHRLTSIGDAHWFGHLDLAWHPKPKFRQPPGHYGPSAAWLAARLDLTRFALERTDRLVREGGYPAPVVARYLESRNAIETGLHFAQADLELRREHGKSFLYLMDEKLIEGVRTRLGQPKALRAWVEKHLAELPEAPEGIEPRPPPREELSRLTPTELEAFAARHPAAFGNARSWPLERLSYGLARFIFLGYERAEQEGLVDHIMQSAKAVSQLEAEEPLSHEERYPVREAMKELYFTPMLLGELSTRQPDILKLFAHSPMRRVLRELGEADLPKKGTLDLQDLLRARPQTAAAFQALPPECESPYAAAFAAALGCVGFASPAQEVVSRRAIPLGTTLRDAIPRAPFTNYAQAKARASVADTSWIGPLIEELRLAPREIRSTSKELQRHQVLHKLKAMPEAEAERVFARLGLLDAFRAEFPSWKAFWRSDRPMLEILRSLDPAGVA